MPNCSEVLGNVVKEARMHLGLTQNEVANAADIDTRTVLNIENKKGNPKLEVLFPLIRVLGIDSRELFYPEMRQDSPWRQKLRLVIEECSEEEAEAIIPAIQAILKVLRSNDISYIE